MVNNSILKFFNYQNLFLKKAIIINGLNLFLITLIIRVFIIAEYLLFDL